MLRNEGTRVFLAIEIERTDRPIWTFKYLLLIENTSVWNKDIFWIMLSSAKILHFLDDWLELLPNVYVTTASAKF